MVEIQEKNEDIYIKVDGGDKMLLKKEALNQIWESHNNDILYITVFHDINRAPVIDETVKIHVGNHGHLIVTDCETPELLDTFIEAFRAYFESEGLFINRDDEYISKALNEYALV